MEAKFFKGDNHLAEFGITNQQAERFAILEAEYLTAGILLEREGIPWWTPSQAGDKVREIRANFEAGRVIEDSDIRSGVGYTAIAHLLEQEKVQGRPSEENPNITLYQTIPQKPADVNI